MDAVAAFHRHLDTALSPAHRELVVEREAARLGLTASAWSGVRGTPCNVELLRIIHRMVSGERTRVRLAGPDGSWSVAATRAGQLRSRPQSFRVDDHVEPAWDHSTLRARLSALLLAVEARVAADPVREASHLVWALTRAQPFASGNERVALLVVARLLRAVDLPLLEISAIERDPVFASALAAATETDRSALEHYLTTAVWNEALAFAEWLGPPPPAAGARWTLADEHRALEALRRDARQISRVDLDEVLALLVRSVPAALRGRGLAVEAPEQRWLERFPDRLRGALDAAARGHFVCPRAELADVRWPLHTATGLHVIAVVGAAGRGISGAAAAHLAIEIAGVPNPRMAPALLLLPDEPEAARAARLAAWLDGAIARIVADSPLGL